MQARGYLMSASVYLFPHPRPFSRREKGDLPLPSGEGEGRPPSSSGRGRRETSLFLREREKEDLPLPSGEGLRVREDFEVTTTIRREET